MTELHQKLNAELKSRMENAAELNPEQIEEKLRQLQEQTSDFIRQYPLTTTAVALGVGFFLGRLFSRK